MVVVVVADSVEIGGNVGLEVDLTVAAAGVRARSGLEDSDIPATNVKLITTSTI